LLALPYDDRQRIIVVPDAVWQAELEARTQGADWKLVLRECTKTLIPVYGWFRFGKFVREYSKFVSRSKNQKLPVTPIPESDAGQLQFFPAGHPRRKTLYVANPVAPGIYYAAAMFHHLTFEHKVLEAVKILAKLGATQIEVTSVSGWGQEVGANASIPLPTHVPTTFGGKLNRTQHTNSTINLVTDLSPRVWDGELPTGLYWYRQQPDWQAMVDLCRQGAESFTMNVQYQDDFGVSGGIEATAAGVGLSLGGKFQSQESTVWRLAGRWASAPHP